MPTPRRHLASRATGLMLVAAALACAASGCSQNPYLAAPGGAAWNVPQTASVNPAEAQMAELNRRVKLLDDNNRQLHTQLAQSEQQAQVYRDESDLLRRQLSEVSSQMEATAIAARNAEAQVAGMQNEVAGMQDQVRGMQASTQVRGNATIKPNTNLTQMAGRLNLGGVPVVQDGDTVRILIPSDQLFPPGSAQLQPQAAGMLDPIASQLRQVFPSNRIGIEGYTDNAPLYGGAVSTSHQLTAAQAAAVLDLLTRRSQMPPSQLFTVAQGSNNPRQTNETPAGRAANRRIELVIYPNQY